MSILNSTQLQQLYKIPATVYYIEIYKTFDRQEFLRLCETVRYYCQKDDISYLLAFSTTDSKSVKIKYLKTRKRGRPQKIVTGKKVNGHCHNTFIGTEEKSCRQTVLKIANAINKKQPRKITKIQSISNGADVHDFTGYILRQSDILRAGGSFDFKEFYNNGI